MKTLKEIVIEQKCRKGAAAGTTKNGAYWVAGECVTRRCGGDGIGNNAPDVTWTLELRHYRDGAVRATMHRDAHHQNGRWGGAGDWYYGIDAILSAETIEDVIVEMRAGVHDRDTGETLPVLGRDLSELRDMLAAWGMPNAAPSPDEG